MAEPELVAITTTILAAIAYLMSSPRAIVRIGVTIKPPPMPRIDPIKPPKMPTQNVIIKIVTTSVITTLIFY